ncbi:MAG TPA: Stp1/IreP family PP2C-type Ser/Thr phosphatase [Nitrospiria bacterium]|nr:Stp1/IreP family PP2C-type Ser/Thr phosphatase [Nitrospiria bacterium]
MQIKAFGQSDVGRVRSSNEDAWAVIQDLQFFIVADGMGGHAAGEIASHMAVDIMHEFMRTSVQSSEVTWPADIDRNLPLPVRRLVAAGHLANEKIFQSSRANPKLNGMGTTMVAVLVDQDTAYVAHVGDSRAYLFRNGRVDRLTEDHSLINDYIQQGLLKIDEANQHPLKHVITRALGSSMKVEVDVKSVPLMEGDALLLCSDGLSNLLTDEELRMNGPELLAKPQAACQRLIDLANHKGGDDNVTVVLITGSRPDTARPHS